MGSNGLKLSGEAPNDQSGRAIASPGDVNGEGFDDVIIGAPYQDASGFNANIDLSSLTGRTASRRSARQPATKAAIPSPRRSKSTATPSPTSSSARATRRLLGRLVRGVRPDTERPHPGRWLAGVRNAQLNQPERGHRGPGRQPHLDRGMTALSRYSRCSPTSPRCRAT